MMVHICARKGDLEIAQLLLEKGADVNQAAKDGSTPLMLATSPEMIQFLLRNESVNKQKRENDE
jgi:ankyrin repeat protein